MTVSDEDTSIWWLAAAPGLWAAHFLLSYATASIWCAKLAGPTSAVGGAQVAIAGYTAIALLATLGVGVRGWRRHRFGDATLPHDLDSREDRHRFLGFATVLLAGLGAMAIVFEAMAMMLMESCL